MFSDRFLHQTLTFFRLPRLWILVRPSAICRKSSNFLKVSSNAAHSQQLELGGSGGLDWDWLHRKGRAPGWITHERATPSSGSINDRASGLVLTEELFEYA